MGAIAAFLVVIGLLVGCSGSTTGSASGEQAAATGDAKCEGPRSAAATDWVTPIATNETPNLPVTRMDFTGGDVTVTDVSRILALDTYGTLATTVYALGLGDNLVGRDVSTGIPELSDLPIVTHNGHELNAEAILDLDPTVILTDYSIGPLEVQMQLRDSGIPIIIFDAARNREVIADQINEVAAFLGLEETGKMLADQVEAEVQAAEEEVARRAPTNESDKLRMVFLYMRGTAGVYYWFGEGSGADDLIDSLGGVDVATEVGLDGSRPINAEGLVKSEPDMYLMMTHGLESVGGVDGLAEVPGVGDTTAGLYGCVVDMDDFEVLSFGPQFPHTLRALADAIYGPIDGDAAGTNSAHAEGT